MTLHETAAKNVGQIIWHHLDVKDTFRIIAILESLLDADEKNGHTKASSTFVSCLFIVLMHRWRMAFDDQYPPKK